MSKKPIQSAGIPVRIQMKTVRSEVSAHLFEVSLRQQLKNADPQMMSPEEEEEMGIDLSDDGETIRQDGNTCPAHSVATNQSNKPETLDLITEGTLTRLRDPETNEETVTVAYEESELTGMEGSRTTVIFNTQDSGLIHMVRHGMVSTALTFKAHHRAICTYETTYMPFQIGIHSLTVDNRLLKDGELILDYIIEIRGAKAERTKMIMKVDPM